MSTARRAIGIHRSPLHPHHGHSKARCVKVLRRLSAYLDDELSVGICKEIRKHLGACPNCEEFVAYLRQTVSLSCHVNPAPLTPAFKARLLPQYNQAAG